ncbi:MAG TPA: PspC domain-containing protein [Solirubrobacterales bacterium]|nr:PspC domain-containing protein [Solirubrobacterales bacterium]
MAETGASPAPRSQPPDRRERPLRRDPAAGIVGGVLAGIAAQLGWDVRLVRVLFLVGVVVTGGLLLAAYAVGWLLIPAAQSGGRAAPAPVPGRRRGWQLGLGVGLLTTSGLLVFRELGLWWSDAVVWPLVLAVAGATLLWAQSRRADATAAAGPVAPRAERAPSDQSAPAAALTPASRLRDLYRGGFGVALVVGAALLFLSQVDALGAARDAAFTAIVAIFALALILAPFIWRLGRSLAAERAERVRSQERAEMAAHLHDSVLQTLTLMQMRADDPREVAALTRRQQRELRAWLAAGGEAGEDRFAAALRAAAEEVEDAYRITVDVVAVGDADLDEPAAALVAATREALTNAAKFAADAGPVSVYAEVWPEQIEAFVRDRGPGFDPDRLPEDRRGVRESIVGRMQRHGGTATIVSVPGSGTEVVLSIARDAR